MRPVFNFCLSLIALSLILPLSGGFSKVWAQVAVNPLDPSHISESGRMFMVKIVPGKKETSLFVLGKKSAMLKFDRLKVEATLFVGNEEKTINLIRKKDHFVTSTPLVGDHLDLKLQSDENQGNEELRIKLKP